MSTLSRDPSDLRDQIYQPSLRLLAPAASPGDFVSETCPVSGCPKYPLRDQGGRNGYCVGYALGNLIDIHRIRAGVEGAAQGVSPRMLYEMARLMEGRGSSDPDGVQSLRSAIKAFYHYGCCPEAAWPDVASQDALPDGPHHLDRLKAAQGVTLGAYYRVRPFLNDYHNALMDADGIIVSAETHAGWQADDLWGKGTKPEQKGRIPLSHQSGEPHAFVILGYDQQGFLVLNSWGKEWGGYRGYPGVALWTYADWARTVMDAWVLRLGVPAPDAFLFSVGDQGINLGTGPIRAGSTARHQLEGHFAHLDDGQHVTGGSYASSRASVKAITDMLRDGKGEHHRAVMLSVGGSLLGLKDAFDFEARRRQGAEQIRGLYPYALLWSNDLIESAVPVLSHLFESAVGRVGPHSTMLNCEIEKTTAGIGRAFWREVKRAARKAGTHGAVGADPPDDQDGAAAELFDRFAGTSLPLHLLIEGVGCNLLARYLLSLRNPNVDPFERQRRDNLQKQFFDAVASIHLIAPTMDNEKFARALGPLIAHVARRDADRVTLWVPSQRFEDRLAVAHYNGSMLDLVVRSFEGKPADAALMGMSRERSGIDAVRAANPDLTGMKIEEIRPEEPLRRRYEYHEVSLNRSCHEAILSSIGQIITNTPSS